MSEAPEAPSIGPCPECVQGKHVPNCDGTSWDNANDEPAPCPCWEAGHPGAMEQVLAYESEPSEDA